MQNQNYLAHYGILGMKWGIRRSSEVAAAKSASRERRTKIASDYQKRADATGFETKGGPKRGTSEYKKAASDFNKSFDKYGKEMSDEAVRSHAELQKARIEAANRLYPKEGRVANEKIATMSAGKAFLQSAYMTSYGALKYNEARTKGDSVAKSFVKACLHSNVNVLLSGIPSFVAGHRNKKLRKSLVNK